MTRRLPPALLVTLLVTAATLVAQGPAAEPLNAQIDRIFAANAYDVPRFGPARWLPDGRPTPWSRRPPTGPAASDIVALRRGDRRAKRARPAAPLVPPGGAALDDRRLRLVGGRQAAADLHQHAEGLAPEHARRLLGARRRRAGSAAASSAATAPEATLMFAKFSPDGDARRLRPRATTSTSSGSTTGTITRADDATDPRRSSTARPTGCTRRSSTSATASAGARTARRIAYWQFDTTGVGIFSLINDTDALYPDDHADSVSEGGHDQLRRAASASSRADGGRDDAG